MSKQNDNHQIMVVLLGFEVDRLHKVIEYYATNETKIKKQVALSKLQNAKYYEVGQPYQGHQKSHKESDIVDPSGRAARMQNVFP